MVSFDATSLYTNILQLVHQIQSRIMLTMMNNLLKKQLYLKTSFSTQLTQFSQPLGILLILSFTKNLIWLHWEDQHLQLKLKSICRFMNTLLYLQHHTLKKFRSNLLRTFIQFLDIPTRKTFPITSTIFIKTLNLLWRKKVMENQRFLTLF